MRSTERSPHTARKICSCGITRSAAFRQNPQDLVRLPGEMHRPVRPTRTRRWIRSISKSLADEQQRFPLLRRMPAQRIPDARQQLLGAEGLPNVVIRAAVQCVHGCVLVAADGQRHNRDRGDLAHRSDRLASAAGGLIVIEQHDIRLALADQPQCRRTWLGIVDPIPGGREAPADQEADRRIVIDDQNARTFRCQGSRSSLMSRLPGRHGAKAGCWLLLLRRVERQIELQHVDMRLADDAEEAALGVGLDELPDLVLRQAARLGDARHLEQRAGGRDVGIEAARRGGDQIDRDRRVRVLGLPASRRRP